MKKTILIILFLLLIGGGFYYFVINYEDISKKFSAEVIQCALDADGEGRDVGHCVPELIKDIDHEEMMEMYSNLSFYSVSWARS
jgi:hypothetical protein